MRILRRHTIFYSGTRQPYCELQLVDREDGRPAPGLNIIPLAKDDGVIRLGHGGVRELVQFINREPLPSSETHRWGETNN